MRLIFWGLVIVALGYVAYSGMITAWSWIAVNNAVDEVISREGVDTLPEQEIRARVMSSTSEAGVSLQERDIVVTRGTGSVQVEVVWTIPVLVVKGEPAISVPLSVKRSKLATGATR